MSAAIERVVTRIIERTLGLRVTGVSAEQHLVRDLAVESIDIVNIALDVEDSFGIEISDEEVAGLDSVGDWIAIVARILADGGQ